MGEGDEIIYCLLGNVWGATNWLDLSPVSVHKWKGDIKECSNWGGISLLIVVCRLCGRMFKEHDC